MKPSQPKTRACSYCARAPTREVIVRPIGIDVPSADYTVRLRLCEGHAAMFSVGLAACIAMCGQVQ